MQTATLLLTLAALAFTSDTCSDAPTSAAWPPQPTATTSSHFRLVVDVTSHDLEPSIQDWAVSSYHIGPCYSYSVLLPNNGSSPDYSRAFYVNGTADDVERRASGIITDGGSPRVPYGVIVPAATNADKDGRRPVQINCGSGTPGVIVSRRETALPRLRYVSKANDEPFGGWYACKESLIYGPAVVLYYRGGGKVTPNGCAALMLYTECIQGTAAVGPDAQAAPCVPKFERQVEDERARHVEAEVEWKQACSSSPVPLGSELFLGRQFRLQG